MKHLETISDILHMAQDTLRIWHSIYTHRMKHLTAEKAAVALASSLTHTLSLITLNQTSSVTRESLRSRGGGWGVGGESGGGGQLGGEALECLPR